MTPSQQQLRESHNIYGGDGNDTLIGRQRQHTPHGGADDDTTSPEPMAMTLFAGAWRRYRRRWFCNTIVYGVNPVQPSQFRYRRCITLFGGTVHTALGGEGNDNLYGAVQVTMIYLAA